MTTDRIAAGLMSEQWVLGGCLLLPEGFDIVSGAGLTDKSFEDDRHGDIWHAIEQLAVACKVADPVSVHHQMKLSGRGTVPIKYLVDLVQGNYGLHGLKQHAERVKGREIERNMQAAGLTIAGLAENDELSTEQKLSKAQQLVGDIGKCAIRQAPRSIADLAIDHCDRLTDLASGARAPGWPTGIPTLDNALGGGLQPGKLVILAARPSVGKSSFSQQLALEMTEGGLPTLFLSQEMPADELTDRAVSNVGRVDLSNILKGTLTEEDWSRESEAIEKIRHLPYHIDDQPGLTLMDIRTKARMVPGLKVLVLDYLQLCDGPGDNRNTAIEQISRGLKTLAKQMGVCVIALSQLNRDVEKRHDRKPGLADLRDSGAIEQDADVVIFLWPVREFSDSKIVGCGIAKNRQGRLAEFGLQFWGSHQRWAESTADINPPTRQAARKSFDDN